MPSIDVYDDFARPDGPIGNGWSDAADLNRTFTDVLGEVGSRPGIVELGEPLHPPNRYESIATGSPLEIRVRARAFSSPTIVGQVATFQPTSTNTCFHGQTYDGSMKVGHFLIHRQIGAVDDIEVSIRWLCPELWSSVQQVAPAAFVDPLAANPTRLGLLPVFDVSYGGGVHYIQNAFRNPENQAFAPNMYRTLGTDGLFHGGDGAEENGPGSPGVPGPLPASGTGVAHTVTLRAKGGYVASYLDGVKIMSERPVPSELQGRDGWGIHVVAMHPDPTLPVQQASWPGHDVPARVDWWRAKSFTGDWNDPIT